MATRTVSFAPSTLPDDLVPAMVMVAAVASVDLKSERRFRRFMTSSAAGKGRTDPWTIHPGGPARKRFPLSPVPHVLACVPAVGSGSGDGRGPGGGCGPRRRPVTTARQGRTGGTGEVRP